MLATPGEPFAEDWARAARQVAEVTTVSTHAHEKSDVALTVRRVPSRLGKPLRNRMVVARMARYLERERRHGRPVDLVHSHFAPNAAALPQLSRHAGVPYVHTEHSTSLTPDYASHKAPTARGLAQARRVFAHAARLVVVSDYLGRCLVDAGLATTYSVIGNPIDLERFHLPDGGGTRDRSLRLVTVGRLELDKGMDNVLRAVAVAAAADPTLDPQLQVIGSGRDDAVLRGLAHELAIDDRVHWLGRLTRDRVAEVVRSSDVYVSGTRVETFGVAVAEALACGTPAVVHAASPLRDLVDEASGVLVEPGDGTSLGRAIVQHGPRLAAVEPRTVGASVRSRFSPAVIGAQLGELYAEVLREQARSTV